MSAELTEQEILARRQNALSRIRLYGIDSSADQYGERTHEAHFDVALCDAALSHVREREARLLAPIPTDDAIRITQEWYDADETGVELIRRVEAYKNAHRRGNPHQENNGHHQDEENEMSDSSASKVFKSLFGIGNNEARIDRTADEFAGAFGPPASEQASSAEKRPGVSRHPTEAEIKAEVDAWKRVSMAAIAAENESVAEYIKQIEAERDALKADAERFGWLIRNATDIKFSKCHVVKITMHCLRASINAAMQGKNT